MQKITCIAPAVCLRLRLRLRLRLLVLTRARLLFSEYYFSAENLMHDTHLCKLMDAEGFVHLAAIAQFRRISKLSPSAHLVSNPRVLKGLLLETGPICWSLDTSRVCLNCAAACCNSCWSQ